MLLVQTLTSCSVGLLVLDALTPVTKQDLALAQKIVDEGKAIVIALNKMDTAEDVKLMTEGVKDRVQRGVWEAAGVHVVPISASKNLGVKNVLPAVYVCLRALLFRAACSGDVDLGACFCSVEAYENWSRRITSRRLNTCDVSMRSCMWFMHSCGVLLTGGLNSCNATIRRHPSRAPFKSV